MTPTTQEGRNITSALVDLQLKRMDGQYMEEVGYWKGRPISKMTRKELLDVFAQTERMLEQERARHQYEESMLRDLAGSRYVRPRRKLFGLF